jgi:hypothetical protein
VTYGCGGSADLAKGYHIFAAKAAYCRRDAAPHTRGLTRRGRFGNRPYLQATKIFVGFVGYVVGGLEGEAEELAG